MRCSHHENTGFSVPFITLGLDRSDTMSFVGVQVVEKQSTAPQKILIVLSDTGGGHKASASSISSAIDFLQPEIEVKTVDVIENYTPWFSNRLYNVSFHQAAML